jgi:hypothetical protein
METMKEMAERERSMDPTGIFFQVHENKTGKASPIQRAKTAIGVRR